MTDVIEAISCELAPQDGFWEHLWPESRSEESAELGRRIRALRQHANMTQGAVAAKLGTTNNVVSQMENGQRRIDALTLRRFAQIFEVSIDQLLGMNAVPKSDPGHSTHAHLGCPNCGASLQLSARVHD